MFSIKLKDISYEYTWSDRDRIDCDPYVVGHSEINPTTDEEVPKFARLGDAFLTSFLPVFDVENDRLGLAKSW